MSLQQAPRFDATGAQELARELYGLETVASSLDSERDQNFLLEARDRRRFILKIANAAEHRDLLEAQNAAMAHAASAGALCPAVVAAPGGALMQEVTGPGGASHLARLLTWLPGTPLGRVPRHSATLLYDLGCRLGQLDAALGSFDHPAIHREFRWDLVRGPQTIADHLSLIQDPALRRQVEQITAAAVSALSSRPPLRLAAIHNDPNDHNVLVSRDEPGRERITGFIDFGDIVHGYRVADIAIAAAYAMLDKPDPLATARSLVAGYHVAHELLENEVAVLFDLVLLRLAMSVAIAAAQTRVRPEDGYLAISQAPIARTLPQLVAMAPAFVEASLREACGFDPVPAAARVMAWLGTCDPAPIVAADPHHVVVLDLSVGSPLIAGDPAANLEPALTSRIDRMMGESAARVGVGRYGEPRTLYVTPRFAGPEDDAERRTLHLGVDLFAPPGTAVHAPLHGAVALAGDNAAPLDYGPLIVLEHRTPEGDRFYTLYGHLTRESLEGMRPGREVRAGEPFAAIGAADVNGGWTPHLHVQLIVDLLGLGAEFPGVCRASERKTWQAFSPDPHALLGVPAAAFPVARLDTSALLTSRRLRIGSNVSVSYGAPLQAARGWMQYLFDQSGRRCLDAYNNVPHVGHSHPRVVEAVAAQMRVLNTNTRYLHESLERYAERLVSTLPPPLRVCYFVNSGTEANELALRLARAYTGRQDVMVLDAGYHGHSTSMIDVSPYKFNGPGGQGARPWVHVAPLPDVYRGPYRRDDAATKYATDVGIVLEHLGPGRLAAFLAETCPSVAGQIMLPSGYLARVYEHVRAAGGVCIADEVQTAYGRLGTGFYAFQTHGVVPDIVVLGKPIGNGYPLGAVITTTETAAAFDNGMEFFSTFGGSTVSCAAGLAVLDVVEQEGLQAHAQRVGERLGTVLRQLQGRHAIIGNVRGSGLFWGVELVTDRVTLAPGAAEARYVVNRLREEGILIGTDGALHNVLKIRPPMPFRREDVERLGGVLDAVMGELEW
ncbi:aminotransferase class III-fold pyridoxal phosphate-dependent enzyme [soil metagenome]